MVKKHHDSTCLIHFQLRFPTSRWPSSSIYITFYQEPAQHHVGAFLLEPGRIQGTVRHNEHAKTHLLATLQVLSLVPVTIQLASPTCMSPASPLFSGPFHPPKARHMACGWPLALCRWSARLIHLMRLCRNSSHVYFH